MPDLITQYFSEQQGLKGLSMVSTVSRMHELRCVLAHADRVPLETKEDPSLFPLELLTTKDVIKIVSKIRGHGYAVNTQRMYMSTFKRFLLWMCEQGYDLDEKKIRAIKVPAMNLDTKRADDLLTIGEIETAIKSCRNNRDRAIIAMLYDGSHRAVEIRSLRWGDILFDEYGYRIVTNQKTGKERKIRHTYSPPYLDAWRHDWIGIMGRAPGPADHVFISTRGNHGPLSHSSLRALCADLKDRTGNKKIRPSIFRPSRITMDVESGADHTYLMMRNWGHLNTRMLAVYAKPSDEFIDRTALERAGMKVPKKERINRTLQPVTCPECQTMNVTGAEYCIRCGYGLTEEARGWIARLERMMVDPDMLDKWAADIRKKRGANTFAEGE